MTRRDAFLTAPLADVVAVAPKTVMLAITGTRRAAALAGVAIQGESYTRWAREKMIGTIELLFRHGVEHIVATSIVPANLVEHATMRDRYLSLAVWGMTGPEAREDYLRLGCRAQLIVPSSLSELQSVADALRQVTEQETRRSLWWFVVANPDDAWQMIVGGARQIKEASRTALMRALYGEDIPPATMFLGFGKPIVSTEFMPPLLIGEMQCYWSQRPGFSIDEQMLRQIFYDHAYLRPTRTTGTLAMARDGWETTSIIGEGQRLGGFWYPAAFPPLS
jgi:hypothetical protein